MLTVRYLKNGKIHKEYQINIHGDDTIDIVKKKIIEKVNVATSFEEIYLFGIVKTTIDPSTMYKKITQNDKLDLTEGRLFSFLQNIIDYPIKKIQKKPVYDYSDFLNLDLGSKERFIKIPIGQRFIIKNEYPFTVNPFDLILTDELLELYGEDILSTQNSNLLFEYGDIKEIFLCIAKDVLHESEFNEEVLIKIYFPYLYKKKIVSSKLLARGNLNSKKLINANFKKYNESIDLFYKMYGNKLTYITEGIQSIFLTIHSKEKTKYPLEIFFKLIHTNEKLPFVKLNLGSKKEKLYRLYANSMSTSGKKIPFLQKNKILNLKNNIATNKSVGILILYEDYEIVG